MQPSQLLKEEFTSAGTLNNFLCYLAHLALISW